MNYAVVLLTLSLLATGCVNRTTRTAPTGQIISINQSLTPDTVDMGTLRSGEVLTKNITLRNDTDSPVVLLSSRTSCGCLRVSLPDAPVKPAEQFAAEVTFDSAGYLYWLPHTIEISTSFADRPLNIVVTATIKE